MDDIAEGGEESSSWAHQQLPCSEALSSNATDALRHSFASYQAALHPLSDVARWMGHSGTQMTESHYRQGVSRKDAEAYLSIIPGEVS